MSHPYLCPNCKTNKTRFNIIEQKPRAVKMDPSTGEITDEFSMDHLDPIHLPYNGPARKIQCGVCGLIEDEHSFIKRAEYAQKKDNHLIH